LSSSFPVRPARVVKIEGNILPDVGDLIRLTPERSVYNGVEKYHREWFNVKPEMVGLVIDLPVDIGQESHLRWQAIALFEGRPITVDIRAFRRLGSHASR